MARYSLAVVSAAIIFGVLDAIWLSWAGPNLYEPTIGAIMAENFNVAAAGAFYVIYLAGMTWFAIRPGLNRRQSVHCIAQWSALGRALLCDL